MRETIDDSFTLISPSDAEAIAKQVLARTSGKATVRVGNDITVETTFAGNEVLAMENRTGLSVTLISSLNGKLAIGGTNRTDETGLAELVRTTEEAAAASQEDLFERDRTLPTSVTFTDPPIYFDGGLKAGASSMQGELVRRAADQVDAAGLVGAGTVTVQTKLLLMMNSAGFRAHTRDTYGEFSMTARTKGGKGSGWAWAGTEDFSRVDAGSVTAKAIDLCKRSDNPVAVEPGRYTVILEPEAAAQLMEPVTGMPTSMMAAFEADHGQTVYSRKEAGNKLGLRMADQRVQIVSDPVDPDLPYSYLAPDGSVFYRTLWFEHGILTNLAYYGSYAEEQHKKTLYNPGGRAKLTIDGPTQTLDEMIASTKRGIWVHRFAAVAPVNGRTLLLTGVTRDGTFMIENGKIKRPIKNLRFNESPFFILNKIDAFGAGVRASANFATPRLKVHDFEFTSLSDAV